MDKKEFKDKFKRFENEYKLITDIKKLFPHDNSTIPQNTKIIVKHKSCGNEFEIMVRGLFGTKYDDNNLKRICKNCRYLKSKDDMEREMIEVYGFNPYIFLEDYKAIHYKMKIQCKTCNSIFYAEYNNIKYPKGENYYCPECSKKIYKEKYTKDKKYFINKIKEINNGYNPYKILKYQKVDGDIELKCKKCNDIFIANGSNILKGLKPDKGIYYCPKCNNMKRSDKSYEERLKEINPNIINLEPYVKLKTQILHKCKICNYEWRVTPANLLHGNGCPNCAKRNYISIAETEIKKFLKKNNIKFIHRDKSILSNENKRKSQELDFYIPDYNLAIECNGLYWHSEKYKENNYHLKKTEKCLEKGIQLIHIYENEWHDNKKIILEKLRYMLNMKDKLIRINGRDTYIEEINSKDKDLFLNENHIQGKDKSLIKLGLFCNFQYEDEHIEKELIAVMTFCKPRRSLGHKKDSIYDYELSRFAVKRNYYIIGGFSKLFKYFERNYDWNNIITYADRRWSIGNLYLTNGFKLDHISKPSYMYYNKQNKEIKNRYYFRKNKLKELFPDIYDDSLTEREIMKKTKWLRVYDCGNYVFTYKRS